ncbi:MFS transporter [Actinomadura craniellae]|uniref:MFS transporter n=1 Tax=Actinomadura craniellae TaxID=2231787 RepID=A0A365H775_9ACTN|nr:MFS transporter [Actinomadura craniellae]RAY14852.1 MFS transporter [Actinomadura craniellae]
MIPPSPGKSTSLFTPRYRRSTLGIVLVVTLLAFEAMAVGTAMPVIARELDGLSLYGWSFSGYLIAALLANVAAGGWIDRSGPGGPLVAGVAVFLAGLAVSGAAGTMEVFVAGRVVQGFGGGISLVALYVLIARIYPEELRPRVFAALATAWVVPSLVGPAVAGAVAEHLHWRWVFLGLIPLVVPAASMLLPVPQGGGSGGPARPGRLPAAVAVAAGAVALLYAMDHGTWPLLPPALAALVLGLPRLLPAGALRLARGLPTAVVLRGLLAGAFFGAEAFIPLSLTTTHGFTAVEAGLVLTLGALGWSAASWYQGRSGRPRAWFVRTGALLVTLGVVAALIALRTSGWWTIPAWIVGGAGMGLALSSLSVLVLGLSPTEEQGVNSAALQICDTLGSALAVGAAGALATGFGRLETGLTLSGTLMVGIAVAAVAASLRVSPRGSG